MSETPELRSLSDLPLTCTSCKSCPAQGCSMRGFAYEPSPVNMSRRALVMASIGTVALASGGGGASAQDASTSSTAEACVALTPEMTEGPYYIDDLLLRDDITEGMDGIPLELTIHVVDTVKCEPLADAAVDIWHCDALGNYSGVGAQSANGTSSQTFLRGVQLTGQNGSATIHTVYPGWYVGRATHIHLKVHTGGTADDGTYLGGSTAHTGQLFFDDQVTDSVAQLEPYVQRADVPRTRNDEDGILQNGATDTSAFFITLTPNDENDLSQGFTGTALLGVDPSSIH